LFWSFVVYGEGSPDIFFFCHHEGTEGRDHGWRQRGMCGDSWEGRDDLVTFYLLPPLPLVGLRSERIMITTPFLPLIQRPSPKPLH